MMTRAKTRRLQEESRRRTESESDESVISTLKETQTEAEQLCYSNFNNNLYIANNDILNELEDNSTICSDMDVNGRSDVELRNEELADEESVLEIADVVHDDYALLTPILKLPAETKLIDIPFSQFGEFVGLANPLKEIPLHFIKRIRAIYNNVMERAINGGRGNPYIKKFFLLPVVLFSQSGGAVRNSTSLSK